MSPTAQKLLDEARQLPPGEREWLLNELLDLPDRPEADAEAEWNGEVGEPEVGYDDWVREQVQASLDDPSPDIPHSQVVQEVRGVIRRAAALKKSA